MTISMNIDEFPCPHTSARPYQPQYQNTLNILNKLLNNYQAARFEEDKIKITEQIFRHLIDNRNILIYEPRFRNLTLNKIDEIEYCLNQREKNYNQANYSKTIAILNVSIRDNIRHAQFRSKLYNHMRNMVNEFKNYEEFVKSSSLRNTISLLKNVIVDIQATNY
jgi:hypothetical protein